MDRKKCNRDGVVCCPLCNLSARETRDHLLFQCPFSQRCWSLIGQPGSPSGSFSTRFRQAREVLDSSFSTEVFLSACWNIWKQRNAFIFRNCPASVPGWLNGFKIDLTNQSARMPDATKEAMQIY
ncbi:hypothetical protein BRADI_5g02905v3 [Brachypodium distachyon]|uniref:Reverse transcriptase zinc-binding domain-containing protein n=1 Tax=Brachypodium distachyon TaxID=15368 RepID=A0A2K2CF48_BRADI|nr:hypothetical protein BRADI_5g02905v3 [Brachypodium distachyon]